MKAFLRFPEEPVKNRLHCSLQSVCGDVMSKIFADAKVGSVWRESCFGINVADGVA